MDPAEVIVSVYWLRMQLALRGGIGVIAKLASSGVLIGTLIPGALLVILGIIFLAPVTRRPHRCIRDIGCRPGPGSRASC